MVQRGITAGLGRGRSSCEGGGGVGKAASSTTAPQTATGRLHRLTTSTGAQPIAPPRSRTHPQLLHARHHSRQVEERVAADGEEAEAAQGGERVPVCVGRSRDKGEASCQRKGATISSGLAFFGRALISGGRLLLALAGPRCPATTCRPQAASVGKGVVQVQDAQSGEGGELQCSRDRGRRGGLWAGQLERPAAVDKTSAAVAAAAAAAATGAATASTSSCPYVYCAVPLRARGPASHLAWEAMQRTL